MPDEIENADMRSPPSHTDAHPAVLTSDSSRQGPKGIRVLAVLIVGLIALAAIGALLLAK